MLTNMRRSLWIVLWVAWALLVVAIATILHLSFHRPWLHFLVMMIGQGVAIVCAFVAIRRRAGTGGGE
jgi:hypothetical protein